MTTQPQEPRTPKKRRWWLLAIPGLVVAAALIRFSMVLVVLYVVQPVRIAGTGMMPTYRDGDRVLLRKFDLSIERGDIVAFHYPGDLSKTFVKRVIGLPGERIAVRGGRSVVNGVELDEPYLDEAFTRRSPDTEEVLIPDGHVYVIGDNRDHSNDSRIWGTLEMRLVYGEVLFQYG
jgi:signal peptidase I